MYYVFYTFEAVGNFEAMKNLIFSAPMRDRVSVAYYGRWPYDMAALEKYFTVPTFAIPLGNALLCVGADLIRHQRRTGTRASEYRWDTVLLGFLGGC